jgi:hypothetical protein
MALGQETGGESKGGRERRLLCLGVAALALLVFLWPLMLGGHLREVAAQRRLAQNWEPTYRIIPLLGLAHARSLKQKGALAPARLERLWREMQDFKGVYPEFFWMELTVLEARAGRHEKARQAYDKARQVGARLTDRLSKSAVWDPWRQTLGLGPR